MPNQRASGQSLIGCHIDAQFLAEIDEARGGKSRSDFLREALFIYLKEMGYSLPDAFKYAPDRTGKGGRIKKAPLKALPTSAAQVKNQTKQTKPKAG